MNFRILLSLGLAALFVFMYVPVALSHPHVFIDNTIKILFDQHGLAGIRAKWVFDEFFSSMIANDYDRNRNARFEKAEIEMIRKKAFSNLANFGYFTFIKINGRPFKVKYARDFSAALSGGKLTYAFFVPCHVKAISTFKELRISQYDPTYYTSMAFAKKRPVILEAGSGFNINYRISKNMEEAYYYDQIHPVEVILRFKLKDG